MYTKFAPKMSDAINLTIEGIIEQSKRLDFQVDMSTYGAANQTYCFGCAATCFLQKATGVNLTSENIVGENKRFLAYKGKCPDFELQDLDEWETAINDLRNGYPSTLASIYNISLDTVQEMPHIKPIWGQVYSIGGNLDLFIHQLSILKNYLIEHGL